MTHRTRISLDGQWYFSPTRISNTDNCPQIIVPAPWQADARFRDHSGEAWYQREIEIPADWMQSGRVVTLGFGAVDYFAEVWLNDIKVGDHEGGYLPFELDITNAVRPGVNTSPSVWTIRLRFLLRSHMANNPGMDCSRASGSRSGWRRGQKRIFSASKLSHPQIAWI